MKKQPWKLWTVLVILVAAVQQTALAGESEATGFAVGAELGRAAVKIDDAESGAMRMRYSTEVLRLGAGYTHQLDSGIKFKVSGKLGTSLIARNATNGPTEAPLLRGHYTDSELRLTVGKAFGAIDAYTGLELEAWKVRGPDAFLFSHETNVRASHRKLIVGAAIDRPVAAIPQLMNISAEIGYVLKTKERDSGNYGVWTAESSGGTALKLAATFDVDGKGFTVSPYVALTKPAITGDAKLQTSRLGLVVTKAF